MNVEATTAAWIAILDDFGLLVADAWDLSVDIVGLSGARDPRIVSVQLFKRLRDSRNGFALLWNARLNNEAETLARNAMEAAICLAALDVRPQDFLETIRSDAAFTLNKQAPIWFSRNPTRITEVTLSVARIFGHRSTNRPKHSPLDWNSLAEIGKVQHLYKWHRYFSGTAAHITGVSLLNDIEFVDPSGNEQVTELRTLRRLDAVKRLCGALHTGLSSHANIIQLDEIAVRVAILVARMNALANVLKS